MYDDIVNQVFALYIISIAGAESAIGLAILVRYYQVHKNLFFITKENSEINFLNN
jgi:NADH-ubiquinone oxidoreductase chain 4L